MERGAGEREEARAPGIVESVRSTVATLLQMLHTRLELVTTELEEEMHRIASLLLWGAVAIFSGGLFVLMVAATVIIAAGSEYRLHAAIAMTGVFLVILVTAAIVLKNLVKSHGRLLAASIDEIKRDRDALRRRPSGQPPT